MKRFLFTVCALAAALSLHAQTPAPKKLEVMLMLPQPKFMGGKLSLTPEGAEQTVFTPALEISGEPGILVYTEAQFKKLGISVTTFAERAGRVADRRLATLKPDLVKNEKGEVQYAVYRDDKPLIASLVVAPSLPQVFEKLFGPEIWVAMPDRHSLFVFPARPEALDAYVADMAERYRTEQRAASPEVFALKKGSPPKVVASFDE